MKRNTRKAAPTAPEHFLPADPDGTPAVVQPAHPVLVAVAEHLRRHGLVYGVLADGDGLVFGMSDKSFSWTTQITVIAGKPLLRIGARLPLTVPGPLRADLAVFLAQLNYGNLLGSWQMDGKDGEVVYVTAHLFGEHIPVEQELHILLGVTQSVVLREGPKILRQMQGRAGKLVPPPAPQQN
jgi:hypothetical protein